jgi:GLPGLI family protein
MKKYFTILLLWFSGFAGAQQFISSGMIEFEVRTNNHRALGDGIWGQLWKDRVPQFSTSWYHFVFDDNKAIYKIDRIDEKSKIPWRNRNEDDNTWYNNYESGTFINQKFVFDDIYLMSDSLSQIEWKLSPSETREIAGFLCRKATGIIFDSVYVFAFYTDEITINGGPMGIHGLPGMILGITIPRMYTSWIATRLQLTGFNTNNIKPPVKGKKRKAAELKQNVESATKDWGTYGQQAVWNLFL